MNYEETIELEKNVKLKNDADQIYEKFMKNIKLSPNKYIGAGKFIIDADGHNTTFIKLEGDTFILQCRFLHENYNVNITPAAIFKALKDEYRGVDHLKSYVRDK